MDIEPINSIVVGDLSVDEKKHYDELGAEIIKNGQVAVCILAGRTRHSSRS